MPTRNGCKSTFSNFARPGFESRHNLKYWTRQPYFGFGVDAHSMLPCDSADAESVRFSTADVLEKYVAGSPLPPNAVSRSSAIEESFFLGLRLNRGVDLQETASHFDTALVDSYRPVILELTQVGLLQQEGNVLRLTPRGRLLSNEVFQSFLSHAAPTGAQ